MEDEQITGEAFGRPGIAPKWTSSTKEAVGKACSLSEIAHKLAAPRVV